MSTMDRGRFSNHFRLSVDKMCFPSSVCKRFLKKCWRAQFHLKMAKVLTRFFCSFIISISTIDRGRFSTHFLLSVDKICFPSSVCESFSINADVHNFISKWRRPSPFLWGDLSFQFQWQWTGVDFPATSFYPWIKCVFLLQSVRISQKMLTWTILSQNGEGPDPIFWSFILSISTIDRGRFSSHFLLSVDKMCFPSSGCESFLKKGLRAQFYLKMADFFGDLYFQFQRPQWTVVDFPTTSSYPGIKCVFPSSVCESFPKKCWRGQFYLKMTKALARFFWWFILSISTPTMDRVDFPATSFYP